MQYLFQSWGSRGPKKYRDMRLETGTEELAHIEMLATAVAMNLDAAETEIKEDTLHPIVLAKLGGQDPRQYLSAGLGALPADANGVPFDMSHIYASGNLAADMYSNVAAEATGRALATRLYNMTDDPGMKDMLAFLIARDSMHQQQWLAVLEELGPEHLPVPNSFPRELENSDFSYKFISTMASGSPAKGRWTGGEALDGTGNKFSVAKAKPLGEEPKLAPARPDAYAQVEQQATEATKAQT